MRPDDIRRPRSSRRRPRTSEPGVWRIPGKAYAVVCSHRIAVAIQLMLPFAKYRYEWIDPITGNVLASGAFAPIDGGAKLGLPRASRRHCAQGSGGTQKSSACLRDHFSSADHHRVDIEPRHDDTQARLGSLHFERLAPGLEVHPIDRIILGELDRDIVDRQRLLAERNVVIGQGVERRRVEVVVEVER